MANYCPYCRGIIGVDCFNVAECGSISQQMIANASEDQQDSDAALTLIRQMLEQLREISAAYTLTEKRLEKVSEVRAAAEKFLEGR